MENYEEKSDQAESDAERLAKEGDRVERRIAETKRDLESKQGDAGMSGGFPDSDEEVEGSQEAQSESGEPDEQEES